MFTARTFYNAIWVAGVARFRNLSDAKSRTIIEYSENTWGASISNRDNAKSGIGADVYVRYDFDYTPDTVEVSKKSKTKDYYKSIK